MGHEAVRCLEHKFSQGLRVSERVTNCRSFTTELIRCGGTCAVVGSGASYPVAVLLATFLQRSKVPAISLTPHGFLSQPLSGTNHVILVTQAGRRPEVLLCKRTAIAADLPVMVISGRTDLADDVSWKGVSQVVVPRDAVLDVGFVPTSATIVLSVLASRASGLSHREIKQALEVSFRFAVKEWKAKRISGAHRELHIVFSKSTRAAACEWENRFSEYGLGSVVTSDIWNILHGRFVNSIGENKALLLKMVSDAEVQETSALDELMANCQQTASINVPVTGRSTPLTAQLFALAMVELLASARSTDCHNREAEALSAKCFGTLGRRLKEV